MATKSISRRDILKTLTMGAMAGSVLRVIPAQALALGYHFRYPDIHQAFRGIFGE